MSVEKIEEQIKNLIRLLAITNNERTLRMYCRVLAYRMECRKATVRAAAIQGNM